MVILTIILYITAIKPTGKYLQDHVSTTQGMTMEVSETAHALTEPLVTVYLPTQNRCSLLQRAVNSVRNQTFQNFELIIIDDASTDATAEYLEKISKADPRISYYINSSTKGACYSRNKAIFKAKGKFITGLDDDDEFLPERLQFFLDHYQPKYAFICSGFWWDYGSYRKKVDCNSIVFTLSNLLDYNEATNQVFTETVRLQTIGGFDEEFVACQDYDTWTRLLSNFHVAKRFSKVTYVVHRDKSVARISDNKNWLYGQQQFMTKHQSILSESNLKNQLFKKRMVEARRFEFTELIDQLKYGLKFQKIRYYVISNLRAMLSIIRRWLS